jgi:pimeloyl-ACP methyl ester carboxylesterase
VRARLLASHGDRAAAKNTAGAIMMAGPGTPAFAQVVEDNLRTSPLAWRAWLEEGSREDISALMPRIDRPVLVLAGEEDTTIPAAVLEREVIPRIRGARLIEVARSRHLVPLDAPQAVADAVRRAVDDVRENLIRGAQGADRQPRRTP